MKITASARKSGRNPRFPYIPVVVYDESTPERWGRKRTQDTRTMAAFATREEAVAFAQKFIDINRGS